MINNSVSQSIRFLELYTLFEHSYKLKIYVQLTKQDLNH